MQKTDEVGNKENALDASFVPTCSALDDTDKVDKEGSAHAPRS